MPRIGFRSRRRSGFLSGRSALTSCGMRRLGVPSSRLTGLLRTSRRMIRDPRRMIVSCDIFPLHSPCLLHTHIYTFPVSPTHTLTHTELRSRLFALSFEDDGHASKLFRSVYVGRHAIKKYDAEGKSWVKIRDTDGTWDKLAHMVVDSIEAPGPHWVRNAGNPDAWKVRKLVNPLAPPLPSPSFIFYFLVYLFLSFSRTCRFHV